MRPSFFLPALLSMVSALPANKPSTSMRRPMTFAEAKYDCSIAATGGTSEQEQQKKKWKELDVKGYLVDWYTHIRPTQNKDGCKPTHRFAEWGCDASFPEAFASSFGKESFQCNWATCVAPKCHDYEQKGLDPRAYLVMQAIQNVRDRLNTLHDMMTISVVGAGFKRDEIVSLVSDNLYEPEEKTNPMAIFLTVLSVLGALTAGGAGFAGAHAASAALAPAFISAAGASAGFFDDITEDQIFNKEDVSKAIDKGLGNALTGFQKATETAFNSVLLHGAFYDLPGSRPMFKAAGNLMADFLADEHFWEISSNYHRDLVEPLNAIALNAALQGSRHFVLKTTRPSAKKLDDWAQNCEKLSGGFADTNAGACYSLQAVRSDNKWPWAEPSSIGDLIKSGTQGHSEFGIKSLENFYRSIEECSRQNEGKPYGSMKFEKMNTWAAQIEQYGKKGEIVPCTFNIPLFERYSICDNNWDDNFPFERPECIMTYTQNVQTGPDSNASEEVKVDQEEVLGKIFSGELSCAGENKWDKAEGKVKLACTNEKDE